MTAPHTEFSVARKLTAAGHEFLLIKRRILRIWRGRRVERFIAAFPRYLFVLMYDAAWDAIREINGVVDFVRIGVRPAEISERVIAELRARLDANGILPVAERSRFEFGEAVMMRGTGSLAGRRALFQYPLSHGRVCVLFEWMHRYVPVEVDEDELEKVSEYRSRKKRRRRHPRHRDRNSRQSGGR